MNPLSASYFKVSNLSHPGIKSLSPSRILVILSIYNNIRSINNYTYHVMTKQLQSGAIPMTWNNSARFGSSIKERFDYMTTWHCRVLYTRFDVRFPQHPTPYIHNGGNEEITHLMKLLMSTYSRRGIEMHYAWAREQNSSELPHFHVMLLVNGSFIINPFYIFEDAQRIWSSIIGSDAAGLIQRCNCESWGRSKWSIMIQRPTEASTGQERIDQQTEYEQAYSRALENSNYLIKECHKVYAPPRTRYFACSELPPAWRHRLNIQTAYPPIKTGRSDLHV